VAAEAIRQGARAWWLRISRDKWKAKVADVRREAKRLRVQVRDLEQSRRQWREKAESLAAALAAEQEARQAATPPVSKKRT
jgi:hypothetical protein